VAQQSSAQAGQRGNNGLRLLAQNRVLRKGREVTIVLDF
jgi:hypothetical protein